GGGGAADIAPADARVLAARGLRAIGWLPAVAELVLLATLAARAAASGPRCWPGGVAVPRPHIRSTRAGEAAVWLPEAAPLAGARQLSGRSLGLQVGDLVAVVVPQRRGIPEHAEDDGEGSPGDRQDPCGQPTAVHREDLGGESTVEET